MFLQVFAACDTTCCPWGGVRTGSRVRGGGNSLCCKPGHWAKVWDTIVWAGLVGTAEAGVKGLCPVVLSAEFQLVVVWTTCWQPLNQWPMKVTCTSLSWVISCCITSLYFSVKIVRVSFQRSLCKSFTLNWELQLILVYIPLNGFLLCLGIKNLSLPYDIYHYNMHLSGWTEPYCSSLILL